MFDAADLGPVLQRHGHVVERLQAVRANPPQSLLLEGGTDRERRVLALYYAALVNCGAEAPPCLVCDSCSKILKNAFSDLLFMDEEQYEEDKKHLTVGAVRRVKPVWGQPPNSAAYRVTVFPTGSEMSLDVSNTLLKSLEEPRPGNVFVLLAPQRERLLQTLVSRSWVLTLAWPAAGETAPESERLALDMLRFWATGRGWFPQTMSKIASETAMGVVLYLQHRLKEALAGGAGDLSRLFDAGGLRRLGLALDQAEEALGLTPSPVSPALVLDWVATQSTPKS